MFVLVAWMIGALIVLAAAEVLAGWAIGLPVRVSLKPSRKKEGHRNV